MGNRYSWKEDRELPFVIFLIFVTVLSLAALMYEGKIAAPWQWASSHIELPTAEKKLPPVAPTEDGLTHEAMPKSTQRKLRPKAEKPALDGKLPGELAEDANPPTVRKATQQSPRDSEVRTALQ